MSTGLRNRRTRVQVLHDGIVTARVRTWPSRADIAHVVLTDHQTSPTVSAVRAWCDVLRLESFPLVRTGALSADAAATFERAGFHRIQTLALLRLDDPTTFRRLRRLPRPKVALRTLRSARSLHTAAAIDRSAFDAGWELDVPTIRDACRATTSHRIRLAVTAADEPAGYMITGRSGQSGFVQRLAVSPEHQGQGIAHALLQDGLQWLARHHITDVLVNTHLDNVRALTLYRAWGFTRLDEVLQVLEIDLGQGDIR